MKRGSTATVPAATVSTSDRGAEVPEPPRAWSANSFEGGRAVVHYGSICAVSHSRYAAHSGAPSGGAHGANSLSFEGL